MPAIGCHVARINFETVNSLGVRIDKYAKSTTTGQILQTRSEHRIVADDSLPNTANYPTVKDYILAEANDGYIVSYMDQNTIVTYLSSDL